ncbi:MAG: hypothetical protein V1933_07615 [Candidatus Omnitrophota bacterium]
MKIIEYTRLKYVYLILIGLIMVFFTGCATTSLIKNGNDRCAVLEKSDTATKVSYRWLGMPVKAGKIFVPEDEKVYWFGVFKPFTFVIAEKLHAEWYSPDGCLYKENDFQAFFGSSQYAATSMRIKGELAAKLFGAWNVKIYLKNQLIDTKQFYLKDKVTRANAVQGETISIDAGKTTKRYVVEKFDEPHRVEHKNDGEVWYYDNFEITIAGQDEIVTYVVEFDANGVVKEDFLQSFIPNVRANSLFVN